MPDKAFYEAVQNGADIDIDLHTKTIYLGRHEFRFQLSQMEMELYDRGGITSAFRRFGNRLFEAMTMKIIDASQRKLSTLEPYAELQW